MLLAILTAYCFVWPHHHATAIRLSLEITGRPCPKIIPCCRVMMPTTTTALRLLHRRPGASSSSHSYYFNSRMHMHDSLSDSDGGNPTATSKSITSTESIIVPSMRYTSRDAASLIRNCSETDGLLVITCDASGRGGGSKHDGMASILRIRHGASYLPETTLYYTNGSQDLIGAFARRSVPSRTSSELAAIAFGMKCALRNIPPSWRQQVLILSDSQFAIDFFTEIGSRVSTVSNDSIASQRGRVGGNRMKGRRRVAPSSVELRDEAHRRILLSLMMETPRGVLFSKVRSSSRGVRMNGANMDGIVHDGDAEYDPSWIGIGFIDHDAADHLSSAIRSLANNSNFYDATTFGVSNVAEPLGWDDIRWLENSENHKLPTSQHEKSSHGFWQTIEVVGSEARCDRKIRNTRRVKRIEKMIGLHQWSW